MNKLLFLDTETTSKEGRLIQIAYRSSEYDWFFNKLFRPPVPIEIEAMAVHHITEEMVKDSELFVESESKENLQAVLDTHILVCHNVAFDSAVLEREGLTVGQKICTVKVAQTLFDFPQYKLQYLRYALNLKVDGEAHSAGGDLKVLIALFDVLKGSLTIEEMLEITANPVLLRLFPFGKFKGQRFDEVMDKGYMQWMLTTECSDDLRYTLNYYIKK
jgi:exodeoxyribonuclease X